VAQHSRLQPGQPVAATDSAGWYPELVTDQPAAEAGKDGRAAGEACTVLLALVGGRASDASAICGDVATDREVAASGRLTTSVIARESSRGQRRRRERCRRNRRGVNAIGRVSQNGTTILSFCVEMQSWLTEIGHKDYSSRKAGLKKEIPDEDSETIAELKRQV
jgi:hypothetical protein